MDSRKYLIAQVKIGAAIKDDHYEEMRNIAAEWGYEDLLDCFDGYWTALHIMRVRMYNDMKRQKTSK